MDDDGFKRVSYKKKKKEKKAIVKGYPISFGTTTTFTFNKNSIDEIQNELKCSEFMMNFKEILLPALETWEFSYKEKNEVPSIAAVVNLAEDINNISMDIPTNNVNVVCYGLGHFTSCTVAFYQLGFLMLLKHILDSKNVCVYDPQFTLQEIKILEDLGLNVLRLNEVGKRTVETKTIFFMPHCDLPLYNNLLWANWSKANLSKLMIIGNSFENYEVNDSRGQLKEMASYVYLANPFVSEIKISNNFHLIDVFNDLAIHYFKSNSLANVSSDVWKELEEPATDENLIYFD